MCDKVNESESLINLVRCNKPKGAGLDPKGKWSGIDALRSSIADVEPSGERWNLSHTGIHTERGKPNILQAMCSSLGQQIARDAYGIGGKGRWKKPPKGYPSSCNERNRG